MHDLIGTWRLTGSRAFDEGGAEVQSGLGPEPIGIVHFQPGRMVGMVSDGRANLPPGAASRVFFAYTGPWTFDGKLLITRIDSASRPDALAEQVREIIFDGPDRLVAVPPDTLLAPGHREEITWERVR